MNEIIIDGKKIGEEHPCYTIAEAGANHDGDLEKAKKLIDAAKNSQSDSIKFQTYTAAKLTTKTAPKYWDDGKKDETQYDVFKKLDTLSKNDWEEIFDYSSKKGITCFSTPFDEESVDLLYSLNIPAFKIASADITHIPLIKKIASKKLPIFLSTGMASDEEIDFAVQKIQDLGNNDIIIMHCITSYPTKPEDANLSMISELKKRYPSNVIGYSDHTIGTEIPVYSTYFGASCIEKHFTFDHSLSTSPDHRLSLDQEGFSTLVKQLRISEMVKGQSLRDAFDSEKEAVKFARRSIVSAKNIPKYSVLTKEMLTVKRPGTGISPRFFEQLIGKKITKDIPEDQVIQWEDISE